MALQLKSDSLKTVQTMKNRTILFLSLAMFAFASCSDASKSDGAAQTAAVYQCPMDCEEGKTYDKPGQCPVCEMDLEKK
jgi:hypothetical protein